MALIVLVPTVWLFIRMERKEEEVYQELNNILDIIEMLAVTRNTVVQTEAPKKKRGRPRKIK